MSRLAGLADQDAQVAGDSIDLYAAHRQLGIERALQQARGFSSPVACESARASLGGLWGALRHKIVLCDAAAHYDPLSLLRRKPNLTMKSIV